MQVWVKVNNRGCQHTHHLKLLEEDQLVKDLKVVADFSNKGNLEITKLSLAVIFIPASSLL